ncbi:MAG TPA: GNAT family N-acetyltransferase [Thermoanaerobaculia bacterium]|nr:GNAT family N-acetyltransferase [Thermoanaerobaculia bacterium]HUM30954.1 GNAT family N-acetyltransferase [Thermoanaerobaculia bacterium]HXK69386.1 GNAT family N-acetyltransferase [Thermoanaerobaculia bacterium]
MDPVPNPDNLQIRESNPSDIPSLVSLFKDIFGVETSVEHWMWKYGSSEMTSISLIAEWDGAPVAHFGGQIFKGYYKRQPVSLSAVTDIMTHPRVRHFTRQRAPLTQLGKLYIHMARERNVAFLYGFPGLSSRRFGERFLGYRPACRVPVYQWNLQPSSESLSVVNDIASLSSGMGPAITCGVVRSRAYLQWRYSDRPGHDYRSVRGFNSECIVKYLPGKILVMDCNYSSCSELASLLRSIPFSSSESSFPRAEAWFPQTLKNELKKWMDLDEIASPYVLEYRPISLNPDARWLAGNFFFSMGDYDVE